MKAADLPAMREGLSRIVPVVKAHSMPVARLLLEKTVGPLGTPQLPNNKALLAT